MNKFEDWFSAKLTVGSYPYQKNLLFQPKAYDVIINVSDEYYPEIDEQHAKHRLCQVHWFALSEGKRDMGLNSIYMAIIILINAEAKGQTVYLHCHQGHNRSWTVAAAYYYFRTGRHLDKPTRNGSINKMVQNCEKGYLPNINEMQKWLMAIRDDLKLGSMKAGILTLSKINALENF